MTIHRLVFEPDAYDSYLKISDQRVLDRLDELLDQLERDPGDRAVRQHRFTDPPVWCVIVRSGSEDWAVLWETAGDTAEPTVIVHYIGAANLTV